MKTSLGEFTSIGDGVFLTESIDRIHVLLIEDDGDYSHLLEERLRESRLGPFDVASTTSLAEALAHLKSSPSPDAVLLDLGLPDSDGLTTVAALTLHTEAPLIIVSGVERTDVPIEAIGLGAQDFIAKHDVRDRDLGFTIRSAIERSRRQGALQSNLRDARREGAWQRRILDNHVDGVVVLDGGGVIGYANSAIGTLLGVASESLLGQPFGHAVVPGDVCETEMVTASGETVVAEVRSIDISSQGSTAMLVLVHDVTHRKEREGMRQESLAMAMHDLKGPLAIISGFAQLLRESVQTPTEQDYLDRIELNAARALLIAQNLFEMNRIEQGWLEPHLAPHRLNERIREAAKRYEAVARIRKVEIRVECDPGDSRVSLDRQLTDRVLDNLMSNALRFSPAGSLLRLAVERREGSIALTVADHGPGIPPDQQPRLFRRFAPMGGGGNTGLGLFIVRKLAEAQHASVTHETPRDGGSRFVVSWPAAAP
jgi:signal transduction histidine kinase